MEREWMKEVERELRDLRNRTADIPARARAGGGAVSEAVISDLVWLTAVSKTGLDAATPASPAETLLGRVTAGGDKGMVCIRNPDNDGWDAINVCE